MDGLLEKLRRGAIRALGGYVEQAPPPKPQDRTLIKSESRRIEKITAKSCVLCGRLERNAPDRWEIWRVKEMLADHLAQEMLKSGAIIFEENRIESRYDDVELRATVYVAMPEK